MSTRARWWVGLTALSAALLALDRVTGPYILFPITFVAPVGLAAWHLGRYPGVGFAVVLSVARFAFFAREGAPGFSFEVMAVNAGIRLAVLVGLALLIHHVAVVQGRLWTQAEKLQQGGLQLRQLIEGLPQLVWTCLPDGHCDYLSRQWVEYTGVPEADQLGYGWSAALHPDDQQLVLERWREAVASNNPLDVEFRIRGASGAYRWFKTRATPFDLGGGEHKWFGTNTDVDDRIQAEEQLRLLNATLEQRVAERTEALRDSEQRFRAIFHTQFQFIGLMSPAGVVLQANRSALAFAGVAEQEVIGRPFWETAWWAHDQAQQQRLREAVDRARGGQRVRFEASHPAPDGSLLWVDFSLTPYRDERGEVVLLIPEGRDITDRMRAEEQLQSSLREKETLLKEVHHRVKNNLAVIASLLYLQSNHTADERASRILQDCQDRVRSMALVHERLYQTGNFAGVEFSKYTEELAHHLVGNYALAPGAVRLRLDLEPVSLDIDRAIPCGLILNELISNALKHAFPAGRAGEIHIALYRAAPDSLVLSVADDGVGLPVDAAPGGRSLGMLLIQSLARQLDARLEFIRREPGTEARITLEAAHGHPT